MSKILGLALLTILAATSLACVVFGSGASAGSSSKNADELLRLEQYRGQTPANPEQWAKMYPVPEGRPKLMAAG